MLSLNSDCLLWTFRHTALTKRAVIAFAIVALVTYCLYQLFFSPLAGIPGPLLAKVSRLWMIRRARRGDMHRTMIALHRKHGGLVRTGPNEVSVSDLDGFRLIYAPGSNFIKSDFYGVIQGHRKFDLFPERDQKVHAAQKRLFHRTFAMDTMKEVQHHVDKECTNFLENMAKQVGQIVDISEWVQLFAFDVIGEVTVSRSFGFLDRGSDDGSLKSIENAVRCVAWIGQIPWLFWLHETCRPYLGNLLALQARNGSMFAFAAKEIQSRRQKIPEQQDILGKLFEIQREKPGKIDDYAVLSVTASAIFAGADTSAAGMRSIIYGLLKYPQHMARLREEIDSFDKQGKLGRPVVAVGEADGMPFLQAVIYEGLRWRPSFGMSLSRIVPESGVEIAGHFLPHGTIVGSNAWVIHRDKSVYGEDADAFNPERWFREGNLEMHKYFFTFGAGSRICLGRNISWMETSKIIPTLFRKFDMELVDPEADLQEKAWFFVLGKGLSVRMRVRDGTT